MISPNPYHLGLRPKGVEGAQTCGAEMIATYRTNILHTVPGILIVPQIFVK